MPLTNLKDLSLDDIFHWFRVGREDEKTGRTGYPKTQANPKHRSC